MFLEGAEDFLGEVSNSSALGSIVRVGVIRGVDAFIHLGYNALYVISAPGVNFKDLFLTFVFRCLIPFLVFTIAFAVFAPLCCLHTTSKARRSPY